MCRSHRPDDAVLTQYRFGLDRSRAAPASTVRLLSHPPPAELPCAHPTTPPEDLALAPPPVDCLPACSAAALPDSSDPAAHMLPPPSTPPAAPPPSPSFAPGRLPPARPALLPASSSNAPTDSLAGSALHNSKT